MSNTPRYVGNLSPPYLAKLIDDTGALISLAGFSGSSFSLTMVNFNNADDIKTLAGTISLVTDPLDSIQKLQYLWQSSDLDTAGMWQIKVVMHRSEGDLEFDPDLVQVLPA